MTPVFKSRWRGELAAYIRFKTALGQPYVRPIHTLLSFDRFAALRSLATAATWRLS
jgi:hypothetical protein